MLVGSEQDQVVVVGAGLGAQTVVDGLRSHGHEGPITLVGEEPHASYDRPPLSKEQLWSAEEPTPRGLGTTDVRTAPGIDFRPGVKAVRLDLDRRRVVTDDGEELPYRWLVIATGARARLLPAPAHELDRVHVLRDFEDCTALRATLAQQPRMVVVGAGFIGCEVAGGAAARGFDVTVVDPLPVPLGRSLGAVPGGMVADLQSGTGVQLRTGVGVTGLRGGADGVGAVELADGTELAADAVLVALGARPATDWLVGSGLELGRGVLTDEQCRASAPGVFAIGDVAEAMSTRAGRPVVVEHWMNARDQGAAVAAQIAGAAAPASASLPYFWSEQAGVRIQALGFPDAGAETHLVSWEGAKPGSVVLYGPPDRTTAAVGFDAAGRLMRLRVLLDREAPREEVVAAVLR